MSLRPGDQIVHKAAWLYYTHGLRQDEIAKRLDISRASVAMYLRRARETGIVTITASTELFASDVLARQLEDHFGLEGVWIADGDAYREAEDEIPVLAANVFQGMVSNGQRVGIAWGRTVYAIADAMSFADLRDVTVVQLCGNLGAPYSYRPDQCTMEIARRLNARGLNFYAPLILSTEALASALRAEPVIREQLAGVAECDVALFSAGVADEDAHVVRCGAITAAEVRALRRSGAAGVIAGQMIDAAGAALDCDYNRRCISADLADLKSIPRRLMVVQESAKLEPLQAALAGRFATHLVLTRAMALSLSDLMSMGSA
ncbi:MULTISPECIES: sugar-binding transcriptional regulator [Mesorhizobium]|uniref:Sugar-binding transcriptional regulator n=1 Tax=Mesorhizobium denitrificans TaxID=2294114 RepID=A0A371XI90_9HYPH|nr:MULTISPECIES: sugar-binding transcriptional regulator [Mesorhizobium]RFC68929.1 sugar-binding transcriptional regulator [Mesorhizobium denitrificans]